MAEFEPGAVTPAVDTPAVADTATAQEVTATPDAPQTPEPEPEKMLSQSEVDRIIQKEKAKLQRRAEREAQEREDRIRREVEARVQKAQPAAPEIDGPQPSQFKDYESYTRALAQYEARKLFESYRQETQQQQQQRIAQERAQAILPKIKSAAEKYEDFNEVATSFDAPPAMQAAMLDSDIAGELYYYLGQHQDELARIASLPEIRQVRAIADLERKLSAPPPNTPKPPAPIAPSAANATVKKSTFDLPWKEFVKQRAKELGRR